MRKLTLHIPGLLGSDDSQVRMFSPDLHALERLLARSRHRLPKTPCSYYQTICTETGVDVDDGKDVPVAAISRMIDDNRPPQGCWMRADPVHLSPDRSGLVLMDSFILNLTQHDALAAAAEVNKVLVDYGWQVEVPYADRWYIRLENAPDIRTTELVAVTGKDINRYLPSGPDSARLHNIMNEIQMQLYACDLNQLRETRGELAVNSVWFWGMGELPDNLQRTHELVFSDDVVVKGLARMTDTTCFPVPEDLHAVVERCDRDEDVLVVLQHCQAPAQYQNLRLWHQSLELLEQTWFAPVLQLLGQGRINELCIQADGHRFQCGRFGIRQFWRRPVPIGSYR